VRIGHLGGDKHFEVFVVVDLLISNPDQNTIIFLVGLLLKNRINAWLKLFFYIL